MIAPAVAVDTLDTYQPSLPMSNNEIVSNQKGIVHFIPLKKYPKRRILTVSFGLQAQRNEIFRR